MTWVGGRLGTPTTPYGGATAPHEAHALVGVRARHYSSPSPSTAAHATAHLHRRFSAPRFKIFHIYEAALLGVASLRNTRILGACVDWWLQGCSIIRFRFGLRIVR
jgi:hypothetical protein